MKAAILTNPERDTDFSVTRAVAKCVAENGVDLILPLYAKIDGIKAEYAEEDKLFSLADILITVGGDGTIIHAAKKAAEYSLPILGINCGNVGFIAELERNETDSLKSVFDGDFTVEERTMLDVSVGDRRFRCFNDAAVTHGNVAKITELTLMRGGKEIDTYRADGIIISTPTGSTAYNLSAGGPIVDPTMSCIIATPICPHSLSSRTLVFSDSVSLQILCLSDGSYLTVDGEESLPLNEGSVVAFSVSDEKVRLIKHKDREFFDVLNCKLSGRRSRHPLK